MHPDLGCAGSARIMVRGQSATIVGRCVGLPLLALSLLAGCQFTASTFKTTIVSGHYRQLADCFYESVGPENFRRRDDLYGFRMVRIFVGSEQPDSTVVEFADAGQNQTAVTFRTARPGNLETLVQECVFR
ncbi:hypothetical protein ACVCNR_09840 [Aquamicrobium terrae]